MPEYAYQLTSFDPEETVDLPGDAVGVTVDTFGDRVFVRYLLPVGAADE